jgi:hypothetical protein
VIDFVGSPDRANAIVVDTVTKLDSAWIYGNDLAEFSIGIMKELDMKSNGPDDTVGNFDMDRVQDGIDAMAEAGLEVPADLEASDIVTNEFIDEDIGF